MTKEILHRCPSCAKGFATERGFLHHKCKQMVREEEFHSMLGQSAWSYYKAWIRTSKRTVPNNASTFITSNFFKAFYLFAVFVKNTSLPSVSTFIVLMVQHKITPTFWIKDGAYRIFLEYATYKMPVDEQVVIFIKTMFDIADAGDVVVGNVFDILTPNEVIQLLRQRRLSPWFLLNSVKFSCFYKTATTKEERIQLETLMNPTYWKKRFKDSPKDIEKVIKCLTEMEL